MDQHAREYYRAYSEEHPQGHFHQVILLHENLLIDWSEVSALAADLRRGWYELSHLSRQDRIEFTREFWLMTLPYHPRLTEFLMKFFASLDDVNVILTQHRYDDLFESHLVYSLAGNSGFFHGKCPADGAEIISLQKNFPNYVLPADYLAFLQIHNGFAKLTDTGVIPSTLMKERYETFQRVIEERQMLVTTMEGDPVNPMSLIPFYQSFDTPFFQCFWGEWNPNQEMGNVYYSELTGRIVTSKKREDSLETLAFEAFTDWLMFYLEKID